MRILGLAQQNSGCSFHRVVLPMGFMDDIHGYITNFPTEEVMAQQYDILLFNRISQFDNNLDAIRQKLNCKIVVDMDDHWQLPTNHLNYNDYKELNPRIENNLREADLVTCTNERLASYIYPFNKNVVIIPNAIPFDELNFTPEKIEDDKLRIFWCGGISHEGDLEILKNPIRRLMGYKDKIKMVLGGYNDTDALSKFIWDKMFGYFTSSGKLDYKLLKGTTPNKYMEMYNEADIMLVPLLESDWSACKSNLKLLEASVKSLPVICSNVAPYNYDDDAPVMWVNNQTDWFKHMNTLINNESLRKEYGTKLNEWAKRKYNLYDHNKTRRNAFAKISRA
jgi:glycosyltransferase involved in cell wall biosynthesis